MVGARHGNHLLVTGGSHVVGGNVHRIGKVICGGDRRGGTRTGPVLGSTIMLVLVKIINFGIIPGIELLSIFLCAFHWNNLNI